MEIAVLCFIVRVRYQRGINITANATFRPAIKGDRAIFTKGKTAKLDY